MRICSDPYSLDGLSPLNTAWTWASQYWRIADRSGNHSHPNSDNMPRTNEDQAAMRTVSRVERNRHSHYSQGAAIGNKAGGPMVMNDNQVNSPNPKPAWRWLRFMADQTARKVNRVRGFSSINWPSPHRGPDTRHHKSIHQPKPYE